MIHIIRLVVYVDANSLALALSGGGGGAAVGEEVKVRQNQSGKAGEREV